MSDLNLIDAVKAGDLAAIIAAVESGADVNQQDEQGWTPLNWAAGKGDVSIIKLLLDHHADVFKVGRDQRTPYLIALAAGRVEAVKLLRQAEADTSKPRSSPDRQYCKAYHLKEIRSYPGWSEARVNWEAKKSNEGEAGADGEDTLADGDIVFIHQDLSVTRSMWHNENVIFNQATPEWGEFCEKTLGFRIPDDLDLITPQNA